MTKVLITGAAGVLGKAVTRLIEGEPDVTLRLTDVVPTESPHEFVTADLAKPDQARPLCAGVDQVLHIAAIHPWKQYTPEQYMDCNIKGTYNILEAAAEHGVRRVIYTSSIAAMGMGSFPDCPLPWDESKPCIPDGHIYCVTKHVGEQFCELFRRQGKFSYLALRPGTFIPRETRDTQFGLGLLGHWLHFADVARAHLLAFRSPAANEAIVITSKVPFTRQDGAALRTEARTVILKYFPRATELETRGITLPSAIGCCYDITKAERLLGYHPEHTFATWLEAMLKTREPVGH